MAREEVFEQALEALLAEAAAEVRHLEETVEVVDRCADDAEVFQLLLRFVEVVLDFFELGEAIFYVLIELYLDGVGDGGEFFADVGANALDAVAGLGGKRGDFELERIGLLLAAGGEMAFESGVEVEEAVGQAIGGGVEIALCLLEAAARSVRVLVSFSSRLRASESRRSARSAKELLAGSARSFAITKRSAAIVKTLRASNAITTVSDSIKATSYAIRLRL